MSDDFAGVTIRIVYLPLHPSSHIGASNAPEINDRDLDDWRRKGFARSIRLSNKSHLLSRYARCAYLIRRGRKQRVFQHNYQSSCYTGRNQEHFLHDSEFPQWELLGRSLASKQDMRMDKSGNELMNRIKAKVC